VKTKTAATGMTMLTNWSFPPNQSWMIKTSQRFSAPTAKTKWYAWGAEQPPESDVTMAVVIAPQNQHDEMHPSMGVSFCHGPEFDSS